MADQGFNSGAADYAARLADSAAQQAYLNARLNLDAEDLARKKAADAWQKTYQEASLTGMYGGSPTLANRQFQAQTTSDYLKLLASLRGPANAFQYARVLQGTPQGLTDIINSAAGKYLLPGAGGGDTGTPTERATIGSLLADVNGGAGRQIPDTSGLPLPNQINAVNYGRMTPTQRDLLLGAYEYNGYRPEDVTAQLQASLPKYGGASVGRTNLLRV